MQPREVDQSADSDEDTSASSLLRDALHLCGIDERLSSKSGRRDENDGENAELRLRTLRAEKELKRAITAISYERKAMASEIDGLVSATEAAEMARRDAEEESETAMSLLASAHVTSLVDEIVEVTMLVAETDMELKHAKAEITRIQGVQGELTSVSKALVDTQKELAEFRKREKHGVGPVLKEKASLQTKLNDSDSKLKSARQSASKLS